MAGMTPGGASFSPAQIGSDGGFSPSYSEGWSPRGDASPAHSLGGMSPGLVSPRYGLQSPSYRYSPTSALIIVGSFFSFYEYVFV